jgi:hypothetical protein
MRARWKRPETSPEDFALPSIGLDCSYQPNGFEKWLN